MNEYTGPVRAFHTIAGVPLDQDLRTNPELLDVRVKILAEELRELVVSVDDMKEAFNEQSVAAFLKELADVQYALTGMVETFNLPQAQSFALVHESNMTKPRGDHQPKTAPNGKVIRGASYRDPDLIPLAKKVVNRIRLLDTPVDGLD